MKNPDRVTKPLVRRPGAADWEAITWEDAIKEIARKVKDTRDATFVEKQGDLTVNFTRLLQAWAVPSKTPRKNTSFSR